MNKYFCQGAVVDLTGVMITELALAKEVIKTGSAEGWTAQL